MLASGSSKAPSIAGSSSSRPIAHSSAQHLRISSYKLHSIPFPQRCRAALALQVQRMATVPEFQPLPTKEPPPSPRQRPTFTRNDSFSSNFSRDAKDDPAEARALP